MAWGASGQFGFYNLLEGDYTVKLIENSLPEHARLVTPNILPPTVRHGDAAAPVQFRYELNLPGPKPLKNVFQEKQQPVLRPMAPQTKEPSRKRQVIARATAEDHSESPIRGKQSSADKNR